MTDEKIREMAEKISTELLSIHSVDGHEWGASIRVARLEKALRQAMAMQCKEISKLLDAEYHKALDRIDYSAALVEDMSPIIASTFSDARKIVDAEAKKLRGKDD